MNFYFILFVLFPNFFVSSIIVRKSEIIPSLENVTPRGNFSSHDTLLLLAPPLTFNWCDNNGRNYCVPMKNQHIPQYCGSCWCVSATQALSTRINIKRNNTGELIVLSCQHVLNCGNVGSCYGGSIDSVYQFISSTPISYETSMPYIACSSDSTEGFCKYTDTTCKNVNIARACGGFEGSQKDDNACIGLKYYPNATISDYGSISGKSAMQKEIYNNGPIICGIDAEPLLQYTGGVINTAGKSVDHVVEVVGWGTNYWIVRNTWGQYWGMNGYVYVQFGSLLIEDQCSWAIPDTFTTTDNYPCYENGSNCLIKEDLPILISAA